MPARVLVVEDNDVNRALLDYLLRAHGFDVLAAPDGIVGLDVARRERPDLILCDVQMPGLGGDEFARRAKADPALAAVPLVAVTALAMVGDRERLLGHGFDGYIAKPIDPERVIAVVNGFLPPAQRAAAPVMPRTAAPARTLSGCTVLVVDDQPMNLDLKRDLLEPHGFRVVTADGADDALALARAERPALIISDVGMPGGSGFDFIRRVKADAALRDIPFVFVSTTHWDDAARAEGLALGAALYLLRPIEPALLLRELRALLAASGCG